MLEPLVRVPKGDLMPEDVPLIEHGLGAALCLATQLTSTCIEQAIRTVEETEIDGPQNGSTYEDARKTALAMFSKCIEIIENYEACNE